MVKPGTFVRILAVLGAGAHLRAESDTPAAADSVSGATTAVTLLVGRSVVVDVATPIARVSLTSADVADALVTSASQLLVHGKLPGSISMFVWNREGVIQRYEITVQRDLERLRTDVKHLFPGEPIEVQGNGRFVVLAGKCSTKDIMDKAVNLAAVFVDKREEVVTLLQLVPNKTTDQAHLK